MIRRVSLLGPGVGHVDETHAFIREEFPVAAVHQFSLKDRADRTKFADKDTPMADARKTESLPVPEPGRERWANADAGLMVTGPTGAKTTTGDSCETRRGKLTGDDIRISTDTLMTARAFARPPGDGAGAIEVREGGPTECSLEVVW